MTKGGPHQGWMSGESRTVRGQVKASGSGVWEHSSPQSSRRSGGRRIPAEGILRASKVRRWLEFEPGGGMNCQSFHPVIFNPVFTPPRPLGRLHPSTLLLLLRFSEVRRLQCSDSSSDSDSDSVSVETCARHWAERTSVSHSSPPLARAAADSNPSHLPRA